MTESVVYAQFVFLFSTELSSFTWLLLSFTGVSHDSRPPWHNAISSTCRENETSFIYIYIYFFYFFPPVDLPLVSWREKKKFFPQFLFLSLYHSIVHLFGALNQIGGIFLSEFTGLALVHQHFVTCMCQNQYLASLGYDNAGPPVGRIHRVYLVALLGGATGCCIAFSHVYNVYISLCMCVKLIGVLHASGGRRISNSLSRNLRASGCAHVCLIFIYTGSQYNRSNFIGGIYKPPPSCDAIATVTCKLNFRCAYKFTIEL